MKKDSKQYLYHSSVDDASETDEIRSSEISELVPGIDVDSIRLISRRLLTPAGGVSNFLLQGSMSSGISLQ
ncbi:hypothetical protein DPMN_100178 [Dreissena polymorpha]|uniref:Uncharacterized protein n=1 Tax=Dreissena polymorpha TaxID=45954 RepID=A0A9D4LH04_DREPO|nr:hypothetical protein DPMN_100178 [Dreissena polymorpha]